MPMLDDPRKMTIPQKARYYFTYWTNYGLEIWYDLSFVKKLALVAAGFISFIMGILFLIFHDKIFKGLVTFSQSWKEMPGGGALLFFLIVLISFPPLIGYSALSSIVGMMYGFPWGWPFLAIATLIGSSVSFLVFRYLLSDYARKLATRNTKFAALTTTLEKDPFMLLILIRLCPLPYSLSNGALASIPSVSVKNFAMATAITSPKLIMHIFIGDRMVKLGNEKDTASKIIDFISIALAGIAGTVTAYIIYSRTMDHVRALEQSDYNQFDVDTRDFELSDDEEDNYNDDRE